MPYLRKGVSLKIDQEDQNGESYMEIMYLVQQIQKYLFFVNLVFEFNRRNNKSLLFTKKRRAFKHFFSHILKEIKKNNRTDSYPYSDNRKNGREEMIEDARVITERTGKRYVYQKVPVNQAGLQAEAKS